MGIEKYQTLLQGFELSTATKQLHPKLRICSTINIQSTVLCIVYTAT